MASQQSAQSSRTSVPPRPSLPSPLLLKRLQRHYDTAMQLVNDGLCLDENGKSNDAINMYSMSMEEIQKGMNITLDDQQLDNEDRESYREMMHKLAKTKMQIESRLDMLRLSNTPTLASDGPNMDSPPSYEEVMSSPSSGFSSASNYSNVVNGNRRVSRDATQIFCIPDGVQIFYITADGHITAPSYPNALTINRIAPSVEPSSDTPPAFLQVGEWVYPMLPGMSPVLHATYGAYIFPDMLAPQEGCAVGLILPDTVTQDEKDLFEDLLASMTHYQRQEGPPEYIEVPTYKIPGSEDEGLELEEEKTSTKVAKGIEKVAGFLAWGLGKGAEHGTVLLKKGSKQIISRMSPGQRKRVDPATQKSVEYLRTATHTAVRVSGYALSKLGDATMAAGRLLAPHIKEHGSKLLPKSVKNNPETASNIDAAVEVAASGIKGFGTVYLGLEAAAKNLARGLTEETVHIVNYKYGCQAAKAAENTLYSVGNVAMTANNIGNFGAKAVAKKAVKETGKAMIFQHEQAITDGRRKPDSTTNTNPSTTDKTKKSFSKPH